MIKKQREVKNLEGLKGWLALLGLGVIVRPLIFILELIKLLTMLMDGTLSTLTDPLSKTYNSFWLPYLYTHILISLVVALLCIYAIKLFFLRKRIFPCFYICLLSFNILYVFINMIVIGSVFTTSSRVFMQTSSASVSIVFIIPWIIYLIRSRRVKNTFIKD